MNYILAHWSEIITALTTLIIFARIIVKLTPTPDDDTALEKVVTALKHIGLVVKDKAPLLLALLLLPSCSMITPLVALATSSAERRNIITKQDAKDIRAAESILNPSK